MLNRVAFQPRLGPRHKSRGFGDRRSLRVLSNSGRLKSFTLAFLYSRLRVLALAGPLVIIAGPTTAASIYKWTDENGNVHYSDRPGQNVESETIHLGNGADAGRSEAAGETVKRMQDAGKQLEASRKARETTREQERARRQAEEQRAKANEKREQDRPVGESWYRGIYTGPGPRQPARPPRGPVTRPLPSNSPVGIP